MYAEAQAGDGMLRRTFSTVERTVADLPLLQIRRAGQGSCGRGDGQRAAPIGEEYAGPVMIEGVGAAQFIAETFVQMMQARRPPDTENPRMGQAPASPFLNRTGLRVMADAFAASDTPSMTTFEGRPLAGSYVVDDEGVRAKDVKLVDKGRLVTLLTSRVPQKHFPRSNGHGRSNTVLAGVFQVESTQAIAASELKGKYLELLKAQDRDFGYIVRGVRSDGPGGAAGPGIDSIFKVTLDGRETPVRGMRFVAVPPKAFRDRRTGRKSVVFSHRASDIGRVRHRTEPDLRRARDANKDILQKR
jgi:hypothetical protein